MFLVVILTYFDGCFPWCVNYCGHSITAKGALFFNSEGKTRPFSASVTTTGHINTNIKSIMERAKVQT